MLVEFRGAFGLVPARRWEVCGRGSVWLAGGAVAGDDATERTARFRQPDWSSSIVFTYQFTVLPLAVADVAAVQRLFIFILFSDARGACG